MLVSVPGTYLTLRRIWVKSFRPTTRRDWHKRFRRHLDAFRLGQAITARDTAEGVVPDFESYVSTRRDASGIRLLLDLIIYAGGLTIPQQIYDHPLLRRLRQDAADIIAWATVSLMLLLVSFSASAHDTTMTGHRGVRAQPRLM